MILPLASGITYYIMVCNTMNAMTFNKYITTKSLIHEKL